MMLREYIIKNETGYPAKYAASESWENLIDLSFKTLNPCSDKEAKWFDKGKSLARVRLIDSGPPLNEEPYFYCIAIRHLMDRILKLLVEQLTKPRYAKYMVYQTVLTMSLRMYLNLIAVEKNWHVEAQVDIFEPQEEVNNEND